MEKTADGKITIDVDVTEKTLKQKRISDYLMEDLVYCVCQLNQHLSYELSQLQEQDSSRITDRIINLASSTAILTNLLAKNVPDIDTVIKNTMSKRN